MEINFFVVGLILIIAIVIVIVVIRRNTKDQKDFEQTVNESELQPEEHKDVEPM
jgi:preprotein translocase subunit YajC